MLKVFEKDGKVNFVDSNNVVVGFDIQQNCCENFNWFFSGGILPDDNNYVFDTKFFEEMNEDFTGDDPYDEIGKHVARFKVTDGEKCLYLNFVNAHNGYCSLSCSIIALTSFSATHLFMTTSSPSSSIPMIFITSPS